MIYMTILSTPLHSPPGTFSEYVFAGVIVPHIEPARGQVPSEDERRG